MLRGEKINKSALSRQYNCCWRTIDRRLNAQKYQKEFKGSNLFFQLIAKRYMNKSTIVTTNMPFFRWGEEYDE